MEQLKNNRWVVLLIGVILIFICAGTVWASNGVRPSYAESASAGMGACELTDVVFDEVLHPEFTVRTASWTPNETPKSASSEIQQQAVRQPAAEKKAAAAETSEKTLEKTADASSKTTQKEASSNVSDQQKSIAKPAVSKPAVAQKSATAAKAEAETESLTEVKTAEIKTAVVKEAEASSLTPPKKLFFSKTALLSQDQASEATWTYALSDEDLLLLERIVMAEAEGEPYAGKVAVANVVLNRLRSANYPDTIRDVIYQRYQFSPVLNGRFDRVVPSEDSKKAAAEALNGVKEVPDDTYYFVSLELATDMTVPNTKTPVRKIGHHTFFK